MSEVEIAFSYLVLVGFITVIIALSGQDIFGMDFPDNPFESTVLTYDLVCEVGDFVCFSTKFFNSILGLLSIPFLIINYIFQIFLFFMTSSTLWWLGAVLFVPAGIVFLMLVYPIIKDIITILVRILHAVAEALPF